MVGLTRRGVDAAKPQTKQYEIRDGGVRGVSGLLLRVHPSGRKTYSVQLARAVRMKLGNHPHMTLEGAREKAKKALGSYEKGEDPRRAQRTAETLKSFIEGDYEAHYLANHKSGKGLSNLKPVLALTHKGKKLKHPIGNKLLSSINVANVGKWRDERLTNGATAATINRNISALKAAIAYAVTNDLLSKHPLKELKRLKVEQGNRVRYLKPDEESRLLAALDAREQRIRRERESGNKWRAARNQTPLPDLSNYEYADHLKPMVLLSMNTGLRLGELLSLRWLNVLEDALVIQAAFTKTRQTRHIPLNKTSRQLLADWRAQTDGEDYVFPGRFGGKLDNVSKAWNAVIKDAKILDFRWHDLRHHFASSLAMRSIPINTIRELLGHSSLTMTQRYAHLAPDHTKAAVESLEL